MSSPLGLIKIINITSSFSFSSVQLKFQFQLQVMLLHAMRQTNLESPVLNQSQTCEHDVAAWWNTKPRDVPNIQVRWHWKVSNDKYVWQFESNLLDINVDDTPVALGLAWTWPWS